jgi:hypothetical protein
MKKIIIILNALFMSIGLFLLNDANASIINNKLYDLDDSDINQSDFYSNTEINQDENENDFNALNQHF